MPKHGSSKARGWPISADEANSKAEAALDGGHVHDMYGAPEVEKCHDPSANPAGGGKSVSNPRRRVAR